VVERHIGELKRGIVVHGYTIKGQRMRGARFREEQNVRVSVCAGYRPEHLCYAKIFTGRPPFYRAWVELFDLYGSLRVGEKDLDYFGSPLERGILQFFASALEPGENLFVEYFRDHETRKQLEAGVPVPASRLGRLLYDMGFTWFKDWYFPEGFMEGEQKLQAEKPLNEQEHKRQKALIVKELEAFLNKNDVDHRTVYHHAYDRATQILLQNHSDVDESCFNNTSCI
jgi:hypothetical protein